MFIKDEEIFLGTKASPNCYGFAYYSSNKAGEFYYLKPFHLIIRWVHKWEIKLSLSLCKGDNRRIREWNESNN